MSSGTGHVTVQHKNMDGPSDNNFIDIYKIITHSPSLTFVPRIHSPHEVEYDAEV